jgi:signal transduction histidine kinase
MVNMKKHSQCSLVVIAFESKKNTIEINYSDNGIGCPEMLNFKKGLQNAENRILSIKGTITFETETDKGFKAKMIIPK